MKPTSFKRLLIILGIFCLVLLVSIGCLLWSYFDFLLHVKLADEQVKVFYEMRTQSLQSSIPKEIAGNLEYVISYYPSRTKQKEGTILDQGVERSRRMVINDIVNHLRQVTNGDLNEKPEFWIQKYK